MHIATRSMTTFHPGEKDDVNQTRSETSPVVETTEVSVLFLTKDLLFSSRVAGVAEHGVTLVDAYVTLGHYDIVAIIEAPDTEAAAAASALIECNRPPAIGDLVSWAKNWFGGNEKTAFLPS